MKTWLPLSCALAALGIAAQAQAQSADDPYGSLAQLDAIEAGVDGPVVRLVVPGASHAPHVTAEAAVLDAVERHLILVG
jgi:hypothetical protein